MPILETCPDKSIFEVSMDTIWKCVGTAKSSLRECVTKLWGELLRMNVWQCSKPESWLFWVYGCSCNYRKYIVCVSVLNLSQIFILDASRRSSYLINFPCCMQVQRLFSKTRGVKILVMPFLFLILQQPTCIALLHPSDMLLPRHTHCQLMQWEFNFLRFLLFLISPLFPLNQCLCYLQEEI